MKTKKATTNDSHINPCLQSAISLYNLPQYAICFKDICIEFRYESSFFYVLDLNLNLCLSIPFRFPAIHQKVAFLCPGLRESFYRLYRIFQLYIYFYFLSKSMKKRAVILNGIVRQRRSTKSEFLIILESIIKEDICWKGKKRFKKGEF